MKHWLKHKLILSIEKANLPFLKLIAISSLLFGAFPVMAKPCVPWSDEFHLKPDLIIGEIQVTTGDIFELSNPKESRKIHQIANKLHVKTKPRVIRRQLLFKPGDKFKKRIFDESVRLIRANRFIKDVEIIPFEVCGNSVNIKVRTNDRWTLAPGLSFGKSGGKNKSGIEFQENNLLGLGKSLSLSYEKNIERHETILGYSDEQFLGTRLHLFTSAISNSDGNGYQLDLSLPYYSLDNKLTWGTKNASIQQENSIYSKGEVTDKVTVNDKSHSIFWGWSKGLQDNLNSEDVSRFKVGWDYSKTKYGKQQAITQSYPWFEYEYIKEQYTTRTNFKSMGEIEDIPLGLNYTFEVGLLDKELGSSENHIRLASKVSKGLAFKKSLGFVKANLISYLGEGKLQGDTLNLKGELFTFNDHGSNLYFSGNLQIKNNLQPGEQLLLGGETGLRGYPKGYQEGTKSIVFTAEKRFHFDWYPYQLAKFGAVIFADAGSAWGGDNKVKVLSDVGFGLRIIPTRTSKTKALHLDFAFPLDADENINNVQITLKTKQNF
ncbi:MAG: outer membrane protein assembly factor BamA [Cocleimonas sp.]|jgi:outer membrane protein assembly factor BamA